MGTITPQSNIMCFQGVPLDNTYTETYFRPYDSSLGGLSGNQQAQVNDFTSNYTYHTFTLHEYQRVREGVLRVNTGLTSDIAFLSACNYMIFKNYGQMTDVTPATYETYGDKYYFAFINNVEYVNERCVNIYYEIDVMQTWMFDMHPEPCLVERQHVTNDDIGANTQAEPISTGELICMSSSETEYFDEVAVLMGIAHGQSFTPSDYDS